VLLRIRKDHNSISDLEAGGTRLTDEESQDGTSEIPAFAGGRLGLCIQRILNGGNPRRDRVFGDLFDGPIRPLRAVEGEFYCAGRRAQ
jgi:hypothetical protein